MERGLLPMHDTSADGKCLIICTSFDKVPVPWEDLKALFSEKHRVVPHVEPCFV